MKFLKRLFSFFSDQKLLNENPIFKLIVFTPASIIASILIIPFTIISFPLALFKLSVQKPLTKLLLYIQHSLSLGGLYVIKEILSKDFQYYDIILGSIFAFFAFYKSIRSMVAETIKNIF